jgi:oxygen-independent coproporphyrinogen-3 oxidase
MEASIYIHVPFCAGACDYCDFYSIPILRNYKNDDDRVARYIDLVSEDVIHQIDTYSIDTIPSIYIGGGTPSILGASGISKLMKTIMPAIKKNPIEISIEANPESLSKDFIDACKDSGINRISLGVQSFSEKSRKAVNRMGSAESVPKALALLQNHWRGNFSVDLMTGLPFQNESAVQADIEKVLAYNPAHISLYSLILEEGTALEKKIRTKTMYLPNDDEADSLWLLGRNLLEAHGYDQYEVSNFAKSGTECETASGTSCLHNIRYWKMQNWIGTGSGASGTIFDDENGTAIRRSIPADVNVFLEGNPKPEIEYITRSELLKEMILMGFRCIEGPDETLIEKRFGKTIDQLIPETLQRWRAKGMMQKEKTALTKEGLLFLNAFVREAFADSSLSMVS